jgi:hypothetical protein
LSEIELFVSRNWRFLLRLRLRISKFDNAADYSAGKRFRLAVVDLDRGKDYPLNFVCLLPRQLKPEGKDSSVFRRVFGEESSQVAKRLLAEALKREDEPDVRGEIERRLKLLEPRPLFEKRCVSCGKIFETESKKWFKQRFCPECSKKRFGDRNQQ